MGARLYIGNVMDVNILGLKIVMIKQNKLNNRGSNADKGGGMRRSVYSYNNKNLSDMESEELLQAVEGIWNNKNAEIQALEAKCKMYESLLKSPHTIWSGFATNLTVVAWFGFIVLILAIAK